MSKIRQVLEQSLELCEGMSLEHQMTYPNSQRLIPLLRELLEQEEECTHTFVFAKETNEGLATCLGCGITELELNPQENGTWVPVMKNGKMLIESSDITHDVTMHVMGDFASINQMRQYANTIANRLNSFNKE